MTADAIRALPPVSELPEPVQDAAEQWHDLNRRITETNQLLADLKEQIAQQEADHAAATRVAILAGDPLPNSEVPGLQTKVEETRAVLAALTTARADHSGTLRAALRAHLPELAETARVGVNQAAADYRKAIDKARAMLEIPAAKLAEAASLAQFAADVSHDVDALTPVPVSVARANFGPAIASIVVTERLAAEHALDRDSLFEIRGINGVVTRVRAWIAWDMLSSLNEPDIELVNQSDLLSIREAVGVHPSIPNPPTAEQKRARLAVGLKRPRRIR